MISPNLFNRLAATARWIPLKQTFHTTLPSIDQTHRNLSNNVALISKVHRESFLRTYQVCVVQPDGSSFYIRYQEPRSIIQLPLDVSTLSAEEMKMRLAKRNPKKKVVYVQEEKDTYQPSKYIKLVKKGKM